MKCPGQDSRYWGPEAIFEAACPGCGARIEFFKDESSRRCRKCGHKVLNPKMDFGCAAYCRFADQCMGDLPPELIAKRSDLLKDRVAAEVKRFLGLDFKRIGRTLKVAEYAEKILRPEGADSAVVTLTAYLSAISEGRDSVSNPEQSISEHMEAAGAILARAGAATALSAEVLGILKNLHGANGLEHSVAFRCVHDAIRLAELTEKRAAPADAADISKIIESFLTESGRVLAKEFFLPECSNGKDTEDR
ncbi:MAG: phosphohydrolase [Syntrophobacteraceae bacterium]